MKPFPSNIDTLNDKLVKAQCELEKFKEELASDEIKHPAIVTVSIQKMKKLQEEIDSLTAKLEEAQIDNEISANGARSEGNSTLQPKKSDKNERKQFEPEKDFLTISDTLKPERPSTIPVKTKNSQTIVPFVSSRIPSNSPLFSLNELSKECIHLTCTSLPSISRDELDNWQSFETEACLIMTEPRKNQVRNYRLNLLIDKLQKFSANHPTKKIEAENLLNTLLNVTSLTTDDFLESTQKYYQQVSGLQENVPSDGNCFFWAAARQFLYLLRNNDDLRNSLFDSPFIQFLREFKAIPLINLLNDRGMNTPYLHSEFKTLITPLENLIRQFFRQVISFQLERFKKPDDKSFSMFSFIRDISFMRDVFNGAISERPIPKYKTGEQSNIAKLRKIQKFINEIENDIVRNVRARLGKSEICDEKEIQDKVNYEIETYIRNYNDYRCDWNLCLDELKNLLLQDRYYVGEEASLLISYLFPTIAIQSEVHNFNGTIVATQYYFNKQRVIAVPDGTPTIHLIKVPWAHYNSARLLIKNLENTLLTYPLEKHFLIWARHTEIKSGGPTPFGYLNAKDLSALWCISTLLRHISTITNFKKHENSSDYIVLISNSSLDGSREGDGDLMDKLCYWFHQLGIHSIRIIEKPQSISNKETKIAEQGPIEAYLTEDDVKSSKQFDSKFSQASFLKKVDLHQKSGKKIILYIGSRFDSANSDVLVGSGSIFTKDFIKMLKTKNVKIIICCLEFKFFKRSFFHLPKAFEMLRQQLFLADKIHFLNQHDQSNFNKTLEELQKNTYLMPHKTCRLFNPNEEIELNRFDLKKDIEENFILDDKKMNTTFFKRMKEKSIFVSGIYTVSPMPFLGANFASEKAIISNLINRPKNILCFGLIRPHKGIEEAIEIGKYLKEHNQPNKIYIVGKAMTSSIILIVRSMHSIYGIPRQKLDNLLSMAVITIFLKFKKEGKQFDEDFECTMKKEIAIIKKKNYTGKLLDECKEFENYINNIKVATKANDSIFNNLNDLNEKLFKDDRNFFNKVCNQLKKFVEKENKGNEEKSYTSNIDIIFDIPDEELVIYAWQCRYAIKFDHKGMANNASTIASCLGMYLPTFTNAGMLTGDDFRDEKIHRINNNHHHMKLFGKYKSTVIMPEKKYVPMRYELCNMLPTDELKEDKLYIKKIGVNSFEYIVCSPGKKKQTDKIECPWILPHPNLEDLKPFILNILKITSEKMHTTHFEVTPFKSLAGIKEKIIKILNESDSEYEERIVQLRDLFNDKVFDAKTVALNLIKELFIPLTQDATPETPIPSSPVVNGPTL